MPRKSNASDVGSLGCTQRHNEKIYEVKEQIPYQFSGRDTDREVFFGTRNFRFYENPNNQQLQKRHVLQLLNSSRTHGTPIVNQVKSRKTLKFKSVNNIVRNLGRRLVSPSLFEPSLVRISIAGNPENVFNKIDHDSLQKPGSAETS